MHTLTLIILSSLVALVSATPIMQRADARELPVVDVCDALQRADTLSNKLIALRGELFIGREVSAVGQKECVPLEKEGRRWPSAVWLKYSTVTSQEVSGLDRSLDELFKSITELLMDKYVRRFAPIPFEVSVTLVGVLHMRTPEYIAVHGPAGFGHLGSYPAEIEVFGVKEVRLATVPRD